MPDTKKLWDKYKKASDKEKAALANFRLCLDSVGVGSLEERRIALANFNRAADERNRLSDETRKAWYKYMALKDCVR